MAQSYVQYNLISLFKEVGAGIVLDFRSRAVQGFGVCVLALLVAEEGGGRSGSFATFRI